MPRISPTKATKRKESARLMALRNNLGMSQRQMAKEFMVSHASISQWEQGERTIPGSVLKLIEIYEKKAKGRA